MITAAVLYRRLSGLILRMGNINRNSFTEKFNQYIIFVILIVLFSCSAAFAHTWQTVTVTGPTPPQIADTVATAYNRKTNRLITYGGIGPDVCCDAVGDIWVLANALPPRAATPQWTKLSPPVPLNRARAGGVYNANTNRLIVFAGSPCFGCGTLNEVWVLTNADGTGGQPKWLQITPQPGPSPAARESEGAVAYDKQNNRLIIFGGAGNSIYLNDVWILSNADGSAPVPSIWHELLPTGAKPEGRTYHGAMVYNAAKNQLLVYGGISITPDVFFEDVWILTQANGFGGVPKWIRRNPTGAQPQGRFLAGEGYDPKTDRLIMYGGGILGDTCSDETWRLNNAFGIAPNWEKILPVGPGPTARNVASSDFDKASGRLVFFGGSCGPLPFPNDVWILSRATR